MNSPQLWQAVRGPVLLVLFGVLMALHQQGTLAFERSWPLLLIVYGICKLLERAVAKPTAPGGVS